MTAPHHTPANLESLTHIESDVADTYPIRAIPVETAQIRTGGSLSSFHVMSVKRKEEMVRIDPKP